ncbi:unnamed protein product [Cylindrotheca closterium]|uniref:Uncharacterized protein n=1 Tax=Cylindrotheca closterium TaxID=2856 RepID=A0AAD2PXU9_9STRA|nr:unnamed protein product [Cylindrotheca closterium]
MNVASPKGDDVYKYATSRRLLYVFMLTAFEPLPARYFWQRIKLYETLTYNHKFNQLIIETTEAFESFLRGIGEKEAVTRAVNKVMSGRETDKGCWRCGLDVEVEDIEEKTIICVYRLKQIMDGARAKMTHNKKRGDRKRKAKEVTAQKKA